MLVDTQSGQGDIFDVQFADVVVHSISIARQPGRRRSDPHLGPAIGLVLLDVLCRRCPTDGTFCNDDLQYDHWRHAHVRYHLLGYAIGFHAGLFLPSRKSSGKSSTFLQLLLHLDGPLPVDFGRLQLRSTGQNDLPRSHHDRLCHFHGDGAHFVAQHVDRHDGQHVRPRHPAEREGIR